MTNEDRGLNNFLQFDHPMPGDWGEGGPALAVDAGWSAQSYYWNSVTQKTW